MSKKNALLVRFAALALVLGLLGCSSELSAPTARIATGVAEAGTVAVGVKVGLDGSLSTDPNGQALAYRWRLVSTPVGSHAIIGDTEATLTWILPDVGGDYVVELTVSDGALTSAPATATFAVGPCGDAAPSVSSIVADRAKPTAGDALVLSADVTDPDLAAACGVSEHLTYAWSLVELPAGSHATLNDAATLAPSLFTDEPGSYSVRLVVTDAAGHTGSSEATLDVAGCPTPDPALASVAASPAEPNTGDTVSLSAVVGAEGGSTGAGADGGTGTATGCVPHFTYHWTLVSVPAGSGASLVDSPLEDPSFVADVPGEYRAELLVTNADGRESPVRSVTVRVAVCGSRAPTVGPLQASPAGPALGQPVALTVSASDADATAECGVAEAFTYAWAITGAPAGSSAHLNDPALESPSFTPDVAGTYAVAVVVTDSEGHVSTPGTGSIVASGCGGNAPVVSAVTASPAAPNAGGAVTLSASASDADTAAPCNLVEGLALTWSLSSVPAGSHAQLSGSHQTTPWFLADLPGTYVVDVRGTDSHGLTGPPSSTTVTVGACGSHAPVIASVTATPGAPNTGSVVALSATSSDADTAAPCNQTETLTLTWALTSVPAGSQAALSGVHQTAPWFLADVPGAYVVEARGTDSHGLTGAAKTTTVTVATCGSAAPAVTSIAVGPASPLVGSGVSLTSVVTDADTAVGCKQKETFSYAWAIVSAPSGSVGTLTSTTGAVSGLVPDQPGAYTVSLVATDSEGHPSQTATQTFTVAAPLPTACGSNTPVARLSGVTVGPCGLAPCAPQTTTPAVTSPPSPTPPGYVVKLNGHLPVKLDGSSSFDPDVAAPCSVAQPLSFAWSILTAPVGSKATWAIGSGPTTTMVAPTFVPDVAGLYQVSLVVSDGTHQSAPLVVQIEL